MKLIETGKMPVAIMTVVAIWSLSLAVDLPGLAVSPILDRLQKLFPGTTQLEEQLLTLVPNLTIIPFVLLSGRLAMSAHKMRVILIGLSLYLGAAALYFLAESIWALILISAMLGIGCGLILPFSTGLVADTFAGPYRMRQMGIISAIGNGALVAATYMAGWLAGGENWHLPFLVYFIPVVALMLLPWLKRVTSLPSGVNMVSPAGEVKKTVSDFPTSGLKVWKGFYVRRIAGLTIVYFLVICFISVVPYYIPFRLNHLGYSTDTSGTVTSIFYLAMFCGGVFLNNILRLFRSLSFAAAVFMLSTGYLIIWFTSDFWLILAGCAFVGLANGIMQPVLFDKAADAVKSPSRVTLSLAVVMSANYVALTVTPIVVDGLRGLLDFDRSTVFPYALTSLCSVLLLVAAFLWRRDFIFGMPSGNSRKTD